jgi:L-fuconolactonase
MRIDAHQHYWDPEILHYFWMPPEPGLLRRKYLPEDLEPIYQRNNIDGSIVVQAAQVPEEAAWLLNLADRFRSILGVVVWVDLTDPKLGNTLDELQRHPKMRGVRHLIQDEADPKWGLRPDVIAGLKELARRGIQYEVVVRLPHLPYVEAMLETVPDLRAILDHIGKPRIADGAFDGWSEHMERLAKLPQLYVKLSGMVTEARPYAWKMEDLRPYTQAVYQWWGPDRVVFGSDWPVCLMAAHNWKEVLAALTQALGPIGQDAHAKLMGENAARYYKLDGVP